MRPESLRQSLMDETDQMADTMAEVGLALKALTGREPRTVEAAGIALFLANLYMGVENVLVRISEAHGVSVPQGQSWHADLFDMFCHPDDFGLPQIIDAELADEIGEYRRFRHVAFHGYGVGLVWERLRPGAEKAIEVFTRFFLGLQGYMDTLPRPDPPDDGEERPA